MGVLFNDLKDFEHELRDTARVLGFPDEAFNKQYFVEEYLKEMSTQGWYLKHDGKKWQIFNIYNDNKNIEEDGFEGHESMFFTVLYVYRRIYKKKYWVDGRAV